jgi:hypothetical protein
VGHDDAHLALTEKTPDELDAVRGLERDLLAPGRGRALGLVVRGRGTRRKDERAKRERNDARD